MIISSVLGSSMCEVVLITSAVLQVSHYPLTSVIMEMYEYRITSMLLGVSKLIICQNTEIVV